jgi:hypothetical protein
MKFSGEEKINTQMNIRGLIIPTINKNRQSIKRHSHKWIPK